MVDIAIVYAMQTDGIRFSIRSEETRIHAGTLISRTLNGLGSGGGHPSMSGGIIPKDNIKLLGENLHNRIHALFMNAIAETLKNTPN